MSSRAALVVLTAVLALAVRSLDVAEVFGTPGEISLGIGDSAYHARRALFSFANPNRILYRDPYIAYPDGAVVPMPPLYDWALGVSARAFGDSLEVFERVAAWVGPVAGALTVIPVYAMGRMLAGHALGLGAGAIFALLPASAESSRVGDVDSHAAVALLGSVYLALLMQLVGPAPRGRRRALVWTGAVLARSAILLSWSGSLLYVGLGESAVALIGVLGGRSDLLGSQALGAAATALLVAPWVAAAPTPIGGPFTATTLSWLHVLVLLSLAVATAGCASWRRRWPAAGLPSRSLAGAAIASATGALALLWIPGLWESLAGAAAFVAGRDSWAASNPEQLPLFDPSAGLSRAAVWRAHFEYGLLAYAIPLAPLAVLARGRQRARREAACVLAAVLFALGALALTQVRFGSDLAPAASVGFALLVAGATRPLGRRAPGWLASVPPVALAAALLWPALATAHLPRVPAALGGLSGAAAGRSDGRLPGARSLLRFARMIREATPETAGYFDPASKPEYGILCWPPHGHVLTYAARRATSANGFGPYLDPAKLSAVLRFYRVGSEERALAIAGRLGARYVVTFDREGDPVGVFTHRLHRTDGSAVGPWSHSEHMRLVVEGPPGGTPLPIFFPSFTAPVGTIPYKLYEIVPGAVLETRGAPYGPVEARLRLRSASGRRFAYRAAALAGEDGRARLRVPYATDAHAPTRAEGPFEVRVGEAVYSAEVSERDVRTGAAIRVGPPAP